jgi:alkanesulfonate monooxygenase
MSLKFHWMLPKGGEVALDGGQTPRAAARYRIESMDMSSPAVRPDLTGWTHFARRAEAAGIDSVLISFSRYEPDPLVVACALGQAIDKLKFIIAYRSGLMQPTTFVQQMNTVSGLVQGRVSFNIVAGSSSEEQRGYGDYLLHDERYARAEEFLAVCNAFWRADGDVNFEGKYYRVEQAKIATPFLASDRTRPEIYVSGHSEQSERLAWAQGSCWLRVAESPEKLQPIVERTRERGLAVCLRCCVLCRPTREEAIKTAESLLPEDVHESTTQLKDDSQMYREGGALQSDQYWPKPWLWTGLVPHYGPVWTTMIGTPQELAKAFLEYERFGVTEFILSGWPEVETVDLFGREIVPLINSHKEAQKNE